MKVLVPGDTEIKGGKTVFRSDWIYVTLESESDLKIKVFSKFKEDYLAAKFAAPIPSKGKIEGGESVAFSIEDEGSPLKQKSIMEEEIQVDDFKLGKGPLHVKKARLDKFKARLVDDFVLFNKFQRIVQHIKDERVQEEKMAKITVK